MKPVIVEMKELSESKEVYESRPNPWLFFLTYIVIAFILIAVLWAYCSKLDIVVKGNGIFRNKGDVVEISTSVTGKVVSSKLSEGQFVKEGEVLFTMNMDSMEESMNSINRKVREAKERIDMLSAYQQYLDGNKLEMKEQKENPYYSEFVNRSELLKANNASTKKDDESLRKQYKKQIKTIGESITEERKRQKVIRKAESCVRRRKNTIEKKEQYFRSLIDCYIATYESTELQYDNQIEVAGEKKEAVKEERKKALVSLELQQISSLEQLMQNAKTTIESLQTNQSSIQAQLDALDEVKHELSENIAVMNEKNSIAAEILTYKEKKKEYEDSLKELKNKNGQATVKADASGYVSLAMELKPGAYLAEGTEVGAVIPEKQEYYAEAYISNREIGKVAEGQTVKFEIPAYPSKEYGYFTGIIESISKDSKVDEASGSAYYVVRIKCDNATITNKNGETGSIRNGMACQAKIIVDEQRVLTYLLKKIDLIE